LPWRIDASSKNFSDWIAAEDVFIGGTIRTITFIAATVDEDGNKINNTIYPTPAHVFYREVRRMASTEKWAELKRLFEKVPGRGAPLKRIRTHALIQGIVFKIGATDKYKRPAVPALIVLSQSARESLEKALDEKDPEFNGDLDDVDNMFKCGNILDPDHGKMFVFYNARARDPNKSPDDNVDWNSSQEGGSDSSLLLAYYKCELRKSPKLPRNKNGEIDFKRQVWFPWNSVINYFTEPEMTEALYSCYEDIGKDAFMAIFKDHEDWLPNVVLKNTKTVTMPPNNDDNVSGAPKKDSQNTSEESEDWSPEEDDDDGDTGSPDWENASEESEACDGSESKDTPDNTDDDYNSDEAMKQALAQLEKLKKEAANKKKKS
jgi:hypothetical protein